ncbi:MAG TPA: YicC/YloC family endoribonuclease [Bryobacteraceae bacterium]|nr:YicC/YloC family endoribonuclease [Bryobacteraceae bacterium]
MIIRSMTGFARIRKTSEEGDVVVSVKSVNHRGLDLHIHIPEELDGFENSIRAVVRRHALRGHLQVRVAFTRKRPIACTLNRGLLEAYLAAFGQAAGELGVPAEPDLNAALSLPGMFREAADEEAGAATEQLLVLVVEEAMQALNEFRQREGAELVSDLKARAVSVSVAAARMEDLRAGVLPAFQARLNERLAALLGGVSIDPQRLAQEVALLADKSDISEELTRLKVHVAQLQTLLDSGGEVGKKLDFLLQEMGRETNTILSKTAGVGELGLGITDLALAAKAAIEKIREQSLNLE